VKTSRIAKLERLARERPCPGCGRSCHPPGPREGEEADYDRLSGAEQEELAEVFAAAVTPACARCGRADFDITRMTDDQLERALHLLRTVMGRSRTEHEPV
jgi:hypothetical protein